MAENLTLTNTLSHHGLDLNNEEQGEDALRRETKTPIPFLIEPDPHLCRTISSHFSTFSRVSSVASVISQHLYHSDVVVGQSTFCQSVFNSVNVLVGVGILALPLAFRMAGWIMGSIIFLFCTFLTNYTAKLLVRCLEAYRGSTYGDIGAAAFGDAGRNFVSCVFVIELFTLGVAVVILLGDGLSSLAPQLNPLTINLLCFAVLTPLLFLPIRKLAYASLIGVISGFSLVIIVVYDGLSKTERPGSLWEQADTELVPSQLYNIPLSFGLIMAGYSGHAVFPSIYRDMEDPRTYSKMIDITYIITATIYIVMAVAGYAMFGLDTMQEITQNLALTPGYQKLVNNFAIWLIVLTPIAKYGLMLNPITVTCDLLLESLPRVEAWCKGISWRSSLLQGLVRILLSASVIFVAAVFPGFDRIVSLLGALFSFGISAIFPLECYRQLFGSTLSRFESTMIWTLIVICSIMAVIGTVASMIL
ncbi:hypothetical protein EC973_009522 [Apophysomyces ossiformis]|uniref:Amino acid transporter transmembrane domain-containing protein n=1 Tax=Apophysomyces ossiformis TaxID=679940 RepID=A0A8H7EPI4_9FUNG|nr:hypothetical protein EC973_009522 [Apophysomyces ossiformis]